MAHLQTARLATGFLELQARFAAFRQRVPAHPRNELLLADRNVECAAAFDTLGLYRSEFFVRIHVQMHSQVPIRGPSCRSIWPGRREFLSFRLYADTSIG